jgi:hypothetical protein
MNQDQWSKSSIKIANSGVEFESQIGSGQERWEPEVVWLDEWASSLDGDAEYRISVGKCAEGYVSGLETSHGGGDSEPRYWEPVPTFEIAREEAGQRLSEAIYGSEFQSKIEEAASPIISHDDSSPSI